jgi:hypothetical protein
MHIRRDASALSHRDATIRRNPMLRMPNSGRRASVTSAILVCAGIAIIGGVAVWSFAGVTKSGGAGGNPTTGSAGGSAPVRPAQPQEIGAVIILAGIEVDGLAAAGFTGTDVDTIFETASAYCLQADRITQFALAHKAVNEAQARVVKPPVEGQRDLPTVDQAQGTLTDLRDSAYSFLTTGLDAGKLAKLSKIRTNKHWGLPAPYLVVDRADQDWLSLRGALAAQRAATKHGWDLEQAPAAVIAAADGDGTVSQAKTDFANNRTTVKQTWDGHSH